MYRCTDHDDHADEADRAGAPSGNVPDARPLGTYRPARPGPGRPVVPERVTATGV
ncbi:hypothetical protein [Streptomyces mobaraensis]|uniref:hypothetical protein n=1 Tax=Streptomyces mobaraensis TaxID=35621 RepID=UPI00340336A9